MPTPLILFLISIPVFVTLDLLWLGIIAKPFYQSQLGHLLGPVKWAPAIIFYGIFLAGLTYFATLPGYEKGNLLAVAGLGAFFGFVTYATYDLTNHATLRGWPMLITVVDIAWGTLLGAVVSSSTYLIAKFFI